jgi:putative Mn2+ efflux pump MntP
MLWEGLHHDENDVCQDPTIGSRLIMLSVATSIDALAVGLLIALLGVSLGLPIAIFGSVTFVVSYMGIVGGFELKNLLRNTGRRVVQALGGTILVGIGIRILVGHYLGG